MLTILFRPRKFSFDPKAKKLYLPEPQCTEESSFTKYFCEGKIVNNDEKSSSLSQTIDSEGQTPLSYLKSVIDSEQDGSFEETAFKFGEFTLNIPKTDEELAAEPL